MKITSITVNYEDAPSQTFLGITDFMLSHTEPVAVPVEAPVEVLTPATEETVVVDPEVEATGQEPEAEVLPE